MAGRGARENGCRAFSRVRRGDIVAVIAAMAMIMVIAIMLDDPPDLADPGQDAAPYP
jgi:hypothetical protein